MDWKEHKKRLLKDPEFRKEYEVLEPEYKLASALIRLRLAKGLTQEQLAKLLNTKQESIARLESGGSLPSLSTIKKVANALDAELEINLRPKPNSEEDLLVKLK
ncbi:MAG: helix-turn-helix transcriptional regulator [Chloroflexi bacterium]|nr:helix-turn-helix transcriptional regulator [Chloroflexota bacterium]